MSTSDIKRNRGLKTAFVYLLITLFCILFGAVYEYFGRGVWSYFMIYNFVFPLVFGVLVFFIIGLKGVRLYPNAASALCYHGFIASLTLGFIMKGVLDIYGTTNHLLYVYFVLGGLLFIAALVLYFAKPGKKKQNPA